MGDSSSPNWWQSVLSNFRSACLSEWISIILPLRLGKMHLLQHGNKVHYLPICAAYFRRGPGLTSGKCECGNYLFLKLGLGREWKAGIGGGNG